MNAWSSNYIWFLIYTVTRWHFWTKLFVLKSVYRKKKMKPIDPYASFRIWIFHAGSLSAFSQNSSLEFLILMYVIHHSWFYVSSMTPKITRSKIPFFPRKTLTRIVLTALKICHGSTKTWRVWCQPLFSV